MRYLRAYRFVFAHPQWPANLLAGAICQLVPVLGQIVFTGYAFEVLETIREDDDQHYPAFDMNQLGVYLVRGLWPLIVQLIVLLPVVFVAWIVGFVLWAFVVGDVRGLTATPRVLLAGMFPALLLVVTLLSVVLVPLTLYVGFRQELTRDAVPFVKDFLKRVGREVLLAQVFMGLTSMSLVLIGAVLCCFPLFAALALAHFAQYHLLAQLYEIYLQRGGRPVVVARGAGPVVGNVGAGVK
jgi:hypothetical protein